MHLPWKLWVKILFLFDSIFFFRRPSLQTSIFEMILAESKQLPECPVVSKSILCKWYRKFRFSTSNVITKMQVYKQFGVNVVLRGYNFIKKETLAQLLPFEFWNCLIAYKFIKKQASKKSVFLWFWEIFLHATLTKTRPRHRCILLKLHLHLNSKEFLDSFLKVSNTHVNNKTSTFKCKSWTCFMVLILKTF